jgi:hypothetical protein
VSSELLREAAALMRSRAEAATDGPWFVNSIGSAESSNWQVARPAAFPEANMPHIASWHPAVALAVAKAMEDVAQAWEISDGWVLDLDDDSIRFEDTVDSGWLAVARAYLNEETQ